jgi:hypothetical protein
VEEVNTRVLFGRLIGVLDKLILCGTKSIRETIFEKSNLKSILDQYYQCPREETLFYVNVVMERLKEIRLLGDEIYQKLEDRIIEDGTYDEETGDPWNNIEVSKKNGYVFFNKVETSVTGIKNSLLKEDQYKENKGNTNPSNPIQPSRVLKKSMLYTQFDTQPENLDDLLVGLKKGGFVPRTTNPQHFKRIFSGGAILSPIKWIGTKEELYYFIMCIHPPITSGENPKIARERRNIWNIVCECFVNADGNNFVSSTMRSQHPPTEAKAKLLQKLTNLL